MGVQEAGGGQAMGKGHSSLGQDEVDGGRSQGGAQSRKSQVRNHSPARKVEFGQATPGGRLTEMTPVE